MPEKDADVQKIKELIQIMKENDLVKIDIQHGDDRISLQRAEPPQPIAAAGHFLTALPGALAQGTSPVVQAAVCPGAASSREGRGLRAFTLIEVLLAVTIFAIVLTAIHMVFYGAIRLREVNAAEHCGGISYSILRGGRHPRRARKRSRPAPHLRFSGARRISVVDRGGKYWIWLVQTSQGGTIRAHLPLHSAGGAQGI